MLEKNTKDLWDGANTDWIKYSSLIFEQWVFNLSKWGFRGQKNKIKDQYKCIIWEVQLFKNDISRAAKCTVAERGERFYVWCEKQRFGIRKTRGIVGNRTYKSYL